MNTHPDAELIALAQQALEHEAAYIALETPYYSQVGDPPPEIMARMEAHSAKRFALRSEVAAITARTAAGRAAKAQVALLDLTYNFDETIDPDTADHLVWSLCNDILAAEGKSSGGAANPDAELLRLCDQFDEHQAASLAAPTDRDDIHQAAMGARWAATNAIQDVTPTTDEGWRRKAAVGVLLIEEQAGSDPINADVDFALTCCGRLRPGTKLKGRAGHEQRRPVQAAAAGAGLLNRHQTRSGLWFKKRTWLLDLAVLFGMAPNRQAAAAILAQQRWPAPPPKQPEPPSKPDRRKARKRSEETTIRSS